MKRRTLLIAYAIYSLSIILFSYWLFEEWRKELLNNIAVGDSVLSGLVKVITGAALLTSKAMLLYPLYTLILNLAWFSLLSISYGGFKLLWVIVLSAGATSIAVLLNIILLNADLISAPLACGVGNILGAGIFTYLIYKNQAPSLDHLPM